MLAAAAGLAFRGDTGGPHVPGLGRPKRGGSSGTRSTGGIDVRTHPWTGGVRSWVLRGMKQEPVAEATIKRFGARLGE